MEALPFRIVEILLSLAVASPALAVERERQPAPSPAAQARTAPRQPQPGQLIVRGRVVEMHAPRVFTVRETAEGGRELLVLSPRPLSPALAGATIVVHGVLRRLDRGELDRNPVWRTIDERTRARFAGRPVMVAGSVLATMSLEAAPPEEAARPEDAAAPREEPPMAPVPDELALPPREPAPLAIRAATLATSIDWLAGQRVRILNARVVGVLEPRALLIEPATPYLKPFGHRDRVLVLVRNGGLTVAADLIVGGIVRVEGDARTLLGMRVASEVPWPARLTPDVVERLEVRAALLATSVQTPEGVELTADH